MKIKEGFVVRKLGTQYVVVALSNEASQLNYLIKLNEIGAFMWEILAKKDNSKEELVKEVLNEYDASEEQVTNDVNEFISILKEKKILKDEK